MITPVPPEPGTELPGRMYVVTASVLSVRTGPGASFPIRSRLPYGADVGGSDPSEDRDGWRSISFAAVDGVIEGWGARSYLQAGGKPVIVPTWLKIATGEISSRPYAAARENPRIAEYLGVAADPPSVEDAVLWSSAFVNWCLAAAEIAGSPGSWEQWGRDAGQPQLGAVAVLRNRGLQHVGFYLGGRGAAFDLLGASGRTNAVGVQRFPASRLEALRWPR